MQPRRSLSGRGLAASYRLPVPPDDLLDRQLPITRVVGPVFRIHRISHDCLHFGRNKEGRFDDPLGEYGVLYAAVQPEAAFAEVFLRRLSLMLIREQDLMERAISEIGCNPLRCVDLTGTGLRRISCDNRIATEKPYDTVGLWSRGLYTHPRCPDGILYRSRHNPRFKCLALFDRCAPGVRVRRSELLLAGARRLWTVRQIAKYRLAIEPII